MASQEPNYKLYYSEELKTSKWLGYPDSNYTWEGERFVWERIVKDENGKDITIKTYKDPIEIIADFKPESKVFGVEGNIERNAVKKFGGALKGFVWLDKVSGGGEVILPFTAPHIFIATGDRLNPELTEIYTDPNNGNYYEIIEGKTRVVVKSFSGIGGAAGTPPTLIAHYKMNDKLATTAVIDETGVNNGIAQRNTTIISVPGKIIRAFDFNGSGDYIDIGNDASLNTVYITVSVWANLAAPTDDNDNEIYHRENEFAGTVVLRKSSSNKYLFSVRLEGSEGTVRAVSSNNVVSSGWHHLVGVYNGTEVLLYVDAVLQSDINSISGSLDQDSHTSNYIGAHSVGASYFNGLIDNVMLFSVELNQHDVNFLWNGGKGREDWEPFLGRLNRPLDYPYRRGRYTF